MNYGIEIFFHVLKTIKMNLEAGLLLLNELDEP